ncbi:response regulator [Candidatus Saccharibacteria bacterium]|nr:response regulator [Candidatus Saccharibacteria bacterium]
MTKIALIEDNTVISQMYRMKFESEGFDVKLATNGENGIALVKDFSPDIILLDIQMPVMNGAEALKKIRKLDNAQETPVIILTNLGEEEAPKDLASLNISSYIVKANLTPSQVVKKVKEVLGA